MINFALFIAILCLPPASQVSLKIDGILDFAQKWSFDYTILPYQRSQGPNLERKEEKTVKEKPVIPSYNARTAGIIDDITTKKIHNRKKVHGNMTTDKSQDQRNDSTHIFNQTNNTTVKGKEISYIEFSDTDFNFYINTRNGNVTENNTRTDLPKKLKRKGKINKTRPTALRTKAQKVTRYYLIKESRNIYRKPHKVKDDNRIHTFTVHVFKQTLKMFDEIEKKINSTRVRNKIKFLARSYKDKFREFVNDTLGKDIKTRIGSQKVILNTIDTSNRILKRLVNYLIGDMDRKGILRNNVGVTNVLEKEVEKEAELEYSHICQKFGICRSRYGFTEFLKSFIEEILMNDDNKLKQVADAFTEVAKNADFGKIMDHRTHKEFVKAVELSERWEPLVLRPMLSIFKNILVSKNQPLIVMPGANSQIVNKTVAYLDIVDTLDKQITATESNKLTWSDILGSLKEWRQGKRKDITEIMQTFVNHVINKGIQLLRYDSASNVHEKIKVLIR